MKSLTLKRAWPLAIAVALIMVDVSILRGERDADELVFEPPITSPATAPRPQNAPVRQTYVPEHPQSLKRNSPGKTNIKQVSATSAARNGKPSIPGTDPKNVMASRAPATLNNSEATPMSGAPLPPVPPATVTRTSGTADVRVKPASHTDPTQGITLDGVDTSLPHTRRQRIESSIPLMVSPTDRTAFPGVRGVHLGLQGETATERLMQLRSAAMDLGRENEELRQQNMSLQSRIKESQSQLVSGAREIQLARKELATARTDLERLRGELNSLREKTRVAEKEHTAVLQSMGPLLQQFLEAEEVDALPPSPTE